MWEVPAMLRIACFLSIYFFFLSTFAFSSTSSVSLFFLSLFFLSSPPCGQLLPMHFRFFPLYYWSFFLFTACVPFFYPHILSFYSLYFLRVSFFPLLSFFFPLYFMCAIVFSPLFFPEISWVSLFFPLFLGFFFSFSCGSLFFFLFPFFPSTSCEPLSV